MSSVRLLWTPYPYEAGFCITDDTDSADFDSVVIIYDFLRSLGLRTTKTVWAFPPLDRCGLPPLPETTLAGITLQHPGYLQYCRELMQSGYEICLHNASAGNNKREQTVRAFELMQSSFRIEGTHICHSKSAENLYWESRTYTRGLRGRLLRLYSRHLCCGEEPGSEFFWGDLCLQHIKQIRLYRTRTINTLKVNPSMPYYDPDKPFVRSWFSATKRSFRDCTTPHALAALKRENGLTVLYQYLHRYADKTSRQPVPAFAVAAAQLADDTAIWTAPASTIMDRLRHLQGIYCIHGQNICWLCNVGDTVVKGVQLQLGNGQNLAPDHDSDVIQSGRIVMVRKINPGCCVGVPFVKRVKLPSGPRSFKLNRSRRMTIRTSHATVWINLTATNWQDKDLFLQPWRCAMQFTPQVSAIRPLSIITAAETSRLAWHQIRIIAREVFFRGRSARGDSHLNQSGHRLENHDLW